MKGFIMRRIGYVLGTIVIVLQLATLNGMLNTSRNVDELADRVDALEQVVTYKSASIKLSTKDRDCLARNMYYEAGNQTEQGQLAVAQITLNRVHTKRWGKSVCDVVYSPKQFSWTLDKHKKWREPKGELWVGVQRTLYKFEHGERIRGLENSLAYHANYIATPNWAYKLSPIKRIGAHIFYVDNSQGSRV